MQYIHIESWHVWLLCLYQGFTHQLLLVNAFGGNAHCIALAIGTFTSSVSIKDKFNLINPTGHERRVTPRAKKVVSAAPAGAAGAIARYHGIGTFKTGGAC